jgi:hypothetical protein
MRNLYACGAALGAALLSAPAPSLAQGLSCDAPQQPMLEISFMFGRDVGNELGVSKELWTDFVASEITPRFPHGLTIDDALGQWRDAETNEIVKEPSYDTETNEKIDPIVAAYQERFQQQAVGIVIRPACASF